MKNHLEQATTGLPLQFGAVLKTFVHAATTAAHTAEALRDAVAGN
jgi:hypothetical protein